MPRVFVVPHYENEALFPEVAFRCNSAQADFRFHVLPPNTDVESPLHRSLADFSQILPYLENLKLRVGANTDDLIIALFDGMLTAREVGLNNLFMAGARLDEPFPCTAVISMRFISWGVLEKKFDYDLQRHALLHLVVCGLLGAYTTVNAHSETFGCLLDFNASLYDFNRKLQRGYYLCSEKEKGCFRAVSNERLGNSIIQLCSTLKYGLDVAKIQMIVGGNLDMSSGDTINISDSTNVSVNSTLTNVQQTVSAMPVGNDVQKQDLQKLLQALSDQLSAAPPDKAKEAETVAKRASQLMDAAAEDKPDASILQSIGNGLKRAADFLKDAVPSAATIAGQIVSLIGNIHGIPI
jgi:hypothetical protein